jgi:hypothetical protein
MAKSRSPIPSTRTLQPPASPSWACEAAEAGVPVNRENGVIEWVMYAWWTDGLLCFLLDPRSAAPVTTTLRLAYDGSHESHVDAVRTSCGPDVV